MLTEHRDELETLAKALLEYETLTRRRDQDACSPASTIDRGSTKGPVDPDRRLVDPQGQAAQARDRRTRPRGRLTSQVRSQHRVIRRASSARVAPWMDCCVDAQEFEAGDRPLARLALVAAAGDRRGDERRGILPARDEAQEARARSRSSRAARSSVLVNEVKVAGDKVKEARACGRARRQEGPLLPAPAAKRRWAPRNI